MKEIIASQIKRVGGRIGEIETKISVSISRELTEEEKILISSCNSKISTLIQNTSYNNHPDTKEEIIAEREALLNCFPIGALIFAEAVPNQYNGQSPNPWFRVTTEAGHIVVGWRKPVIVVDWKDSTCLLSAHMLFPLEDVTKFEQSIHAYGYQKAREYIGKIFQNS